MPQLDPAVFLPQIAWLALLFALLYGAMAWFALPRIGRVLARRRQAIAADLDKASELREQTTALIASHDAAMKEARAQAQDGLRTIAEKAAAEAAQRQAALAERLAGQIRDAERRIAAERSQALANVGEMAAAITSDGLARLGVAIESSAARQAVARAQR